MSSLEIRSPLDFFRDQVCHATQSLQLQLDGEIEFYLVNLLCDFINPSQLDIDDSMTIMDTPLAFMLKRAQESSPGNQIKVYKRLGDTSLYFAGYFQDYFNRKTFDISYYKTMGSSAYQQVSILLKTQSGGGQFARMYSCLASEFDKLVTIVAEVSESKPLSQDLDLLTAYNRWQQNQSVKLKKILEDEGIIPVQLPTKDTQ